MSPSDRLATVLRICEEALGLEGAERAAYLDAACGGDAALRSEVEALLQVSAGADGFLDTPPWAAPALAVGQRLGPYEIMGRLGAGGMGQVYEARDSRLGRTVAIKVLPPDLAAEPAQRLRFEQEARAVSGLNHPHICALHDVGEHDGTVFLVLERLFGETLAMRLQRGPLPLDQALTAATEIADALAAAHRQGVVHRDLKPGNVMLTKSGAKLLDFSLAKLKPTSASLTASPTGALMPGPPPHGSATAAGVVMGTLPYIAPEQLEGKDPDARSDIFSFGTVLYEMLTARRAFEGESHAKVIEGILGLEPPTLSWLQPVTPPAVERVVRRCLARQPEDRWGSASDVADELRWIVQGGGATHAIHEISTRAWRRAIVWAGVGLSAGVVLAALAAVLIGRFDWSSSGSTPPITRSIVEVHPAEQLGGLARTAVALSPDGRTLAFAGVRGKQVQIYLRPRARLDAVPLPGTEGGGNPFFSPDGQWLGFWAASELRKVVVGGGPPIPICKAPRMDGASWSSDNRIIFGNLTGGLYQVAASGGKAEAITTIDHSKGEVSHRLPHVLPGGDVLFTIAHSRWPKWSETQVALYSRRTRTYEVLFDGGADARYVPTGYLVYVREGSLMARRFDLRRGRVTDGPVGLSLDVEQAAYHPESPKDTGAGQFAISPTGDLAYVPGNVVAEVPTSLVLVDRAGHGMPIPLSPPRPFVQPRFSPDGNRIAVATSGKSRDIWVLDTGRGGLIKLTSDGSSGSPVWTPDGERIIYRSGSHGPDNLFWRPSDGTGTPERISTSRNHQVPASCSPDGETLVLYDLQRESEDPRSTRLETLSLRSGAQKPMPFIESGLWLSGADVSPDGQWIAYATNEAGREQTYVQAFGRPGQRQPVSGSRGGMAPVWRNDGKEIVFIVPPANDAPEGTIDVMAVPVTMTPVFVPGTPRRLFDVSYPSATLRVERHYDVAPDGQRFVFVAAADVRVAAITQVVFVQNWLEELKAKVRPTR